MDQAKIGSFLKELRKEKNLTQVQLAEEFNVASRTVSRWENSNYIARFSTGTFDTDATMILECEFDSEQFNQEIARLENLQMVIRSGSEEYMNKVLYDTTFYNLPAYITIDGFGNTYEYALVDSRNNKIVYIYLAYPEIESFEWKDYLKKDISSYSNEDNTSLFSMYNHSFDGGSTYVEYDD